MIKIRAVGPLEMPALYCLMQQPEAVILPWVETEYDVPALPSGGRSPVGMALLAGLRGLVIATSQRLPLGMQFSPAMFAAMSHGRVLGVIALTPGQIKSQRWHISFLAVDPHESAFDIGHSLLQFAINRYGAEGVQSFVARVNSLEDNALSVLKTSGFRHCTRQHFYQGAFCPKNEVSPRILEALPSLREVSALAEAGSEQEPTSSLHAPPILTGFRTAAGRDRQRIAQLYRDALPVEVRSALNRPAETFAPSFSLNTQDRYRGIFRKSWVVETRGQEDLQAWADLSTTNFSNFNLHLMLSPAWQDGALELLARLRHEILKMSQKPVVTVMVFEFQQSCIQALKDAETGLDSEQSFTWEFSNEIVVRDYWQAVRPRSALDQASAMLLYGDKPSTASSMH